MGKEEESEKGEREQEKGKGKKVNCETENQQECLSVIAVIIPSEKTEPRWWRPHSPVLLGCPQMLLQRTCTSPSREVHFPHPESLRSDGLARLCLIGSKDRVIGSDITGSITCICLQTASDLQHPPEATFVCVWVCVLGS